LAGSKNLRNGCRCIEGRPLTVRIGFQSFRAGAFAQYPQAGQSACGDWTVSSRTKKMCANAAHRGEGVLKCLTDEGRVAVRPGGQVVRLDHGGRLRGENVGAEIE